MFSVSKTTPGERSQSMSAAEKVSTTPANNVSQRKIHFWLEGMGILSPFRVSVLPVPPSSSWVTKERKQELIILYTNRTDWLLEKRYQRTKEGTDVFRVTDRIGMAREMSYDSKHHSLSNFHPHQQKQREFNRGRCLFLDQFPSIPFRGDVRLRSQPLPPSDVEKWLDDFSGYCFL